MVKRNFNLENRKWVPLSLNDIELARFDEEMVKRSFTKRSVFMKYVFKRWCAMVDRGEIKTPKPQPDLEKEKING